MVDWEKELRKYIAKKIKEKIGFDVNPDEITTLEINTDIDLNQLDVEELAMVYAFAIMREDFEYAKTISDELKTRDCEIKIDIDEKNKSGAINVYMKPKTEVAYLDIKLKVLPDGMMIDFDKQEF